MELTQEQKLYAQVVQKAWEDPNFKQALINSPEAAIRQATGESFNIPAGKALKVVDQSDASFTYLNIPARPNFDDMELTDEQLELVAGGEFLISGVIISAISTAVMTAQLTYSIGKDKKAETAE